MVGKNVDVGMVAPTHTRHQLPSARAIVGEKRKQSKGKQKKKCEIKIESYYRNM